MCEQSVSGQWGLVLPNIIGLDVLSKVKLVLIQL